MFIFLNKFLEAEVLGQMMFLTYCQIACYKVHSICQFVPPSIAQNDNFLNVIISEKERFNKFIGNLSSFSFFL